MCRSDRSPFDTLETTFRLLVAGPQPLSLEGRSIGLTAQSIRLWELRYDLKLWTVPCTRARRTLLLDQPKWETGGATPVRRVTPHAECSG